MEKQNNLIILTNRFVGLSSNTLDPNLFQTSPSPQAFNFSGDQMEESLLSIDSILFCGRSIPFEKPRNFRAAYGDQSLLTSDTDHSFKRQLSLRRDSTVAGARSNSPGRLTSKASIAQAGICRYGSGSPRKYKAIIGVTKFHSKMEINDIKRRQSLQQAPTPLVPADFNGGEAVVTVGRRGGRHCHWGLLLSRGLPSAASHTYDDDIGIYHARL